MGHRFAEIAFTPKVKAFQEELGSRRGYARMEGGEESHAELGPREAAFIKGRDSLYMASVSETGWPYVQHRGGPAGFVRVLDPKTLGFADFKGNRQYLSLANLSGDDRVSLFFMDYPSRTRLKLLGHAERIALGQTELLEKLALPGYPAQVEGGFLIHVEAFDWNCPQHITPRFTAAEIEAATAPLRERIAELEAQLEGRGAA
jgi:hypothetical protein